LLKKKKKKKKKKKGKRNWHILIMLWFVELLDFLQGESEQGQDRTDRVDE